MFSRYDPRYELDENGNGIYRGHFDDGFVKIWHVLATQASKSEVYRRLMGVPEGQFRRLNDDDLELYAAVVARARDLVDASFRCATFHVLFWDTNDDESKAMLDRLSVLGFNLHRMSAILPDYDYAVDGSTYRIHPQDGHPNALANELIADYVVETIFPNEPRCDRSTMNRSWLSAATTPQRCC